MAQLKKHAAFLEQLHSMVVKEAKAGTATGKPGGDTHPVSYCLSLVFANL